MNPSTQQRIDHLLEPGEPQRIATGYTFTEGPLWDPAARQYYFADVRDDKLYRVVPGRDPELVRETSNGNGTCFDLDGRIVQCEGLRRRVTRWNPADGTLETLADRADGRRLNRPNDVICRSNGDIYFSDPAFRVPIEDRELDAAVWRVAPNGDVALVANVEYPNGLCFSPDETRLYVANTRWNKYIHELTLDAAGTVVSRRIFADMTWHEAPGAPDGIKCDAEGRVYCTGPGGIWVFGPDGLYLGTIEHPQPAVNFCFGGEDMRTLFVCAHDSVYVRRMRVPGQPHPYAARLGR